MKNRKIKQIGNTNKKEIKSLPFSEFICMLPLILIIVFLPMAAYGHVFIIDPIFRNVTMTTSDLGLDVFLYCKAVVLYFAAILAGFLLLCFLLLERKVLFFEKWMITILVYVVCVLLSCFLSESPSTAFWGGEDMFQGGWAHLSYCFLFYYAYACFRYDQDRRKKMLICILRSVLVVSLLLSVVGILQLAGCDPLKLSVVQNLIIPDNAEITLKETDKIAMTLYNSNYVGVMCLLLIPLLAAGYIVEKNIARLLYALSALLLLVCLVASGARSSMIILILAVISVLLLLVFSKTWYSKKLIRMSFIVMPIGMLLFLMIMLCFSNRYYRVKTYRNDLNLFAADENGVQIKMSNSFVRCSWDDEGFYAFDEKGNKIETKILKKKRRRELLELLPENVTGINSGREFVPFKIKTDGYNGLPIFSGKIEGISGDIDGYVFLIHKLPYFITKIEDSYYYYNYFGKFVVPVDTEDALPVRFYRIASNRGYIWSKTIPLLKHYIFKGAGPGHFPLVFPNHDYAAKEKIMKLDTLYNKPHNWYLQMAVETGVLSAVMIVILLFLVIKDGIKMVLTNGIIRDKSGKWKKNNLQILFFYSIIMYILDMFLNDEMIVTAPVFWVIMGVYMGFLSVGDD